MEWINERPDSVDLLVKAVPRAAKNEILGLHDNALKVRLTTPPIEGKANVALIKFLSKALRVSKSQIKLLRGETDRLKTLRITGITKASLLERINL